MLTDEPRKGAVVATPWRARERVATAPQGGSLGGRSRAIGAVVLVSALLLIGLAGSWHTPGPAMDEGIVLEYPQLILHGEVPFRDFQSSYGPGTYLPLSVAYEVLGPSVNVERAVGVAYRLAIVLAVLALLWPVGAALAVVGGSVATMTIIGFAAPPVAYGWELALACVLWGLWCARTAMLAQRVRSTAALWGASGLLVGVAACTRPDLGVAALLSSAVLVLGARAKSRVLFAAGLLLGASPLIWNLAAAGWSNVWTYGVVARLHQLPMSGYPFPTGEGYLVVASFSTLLLAVAAIVELRRRGANPLTRCWLALAILSVLILPQLFQRADNGHFGFIAVVSLGLLPWAVRRRNPSRVTVIAVLLISAIVVGSGSAGSRVQAGTLGVASSTDVAEQQHVVGWLDTHVAAGRRLFVGPADLRWAFFTSTQLYFLAPQLKPAGFYLELGPGDDTPQFTRRLIEDLRRSDVLVLDSLPIASWRDQIWPDARIGSAAPNLLVRQEFRPALAAGPYEIWCRPGSCR